MSAKPLVIQTEQLSDRAHAWLSERVELVKAGPEDAVFTASPESAMKLPSPAEARPIDCAGGGVFLQPMCVSHSLPTGVRTVSTPTAHDRRAVLQ